MEQYPATSAQRWATIGAITGWVTVLLQLYLIITNRTTSIPETIIRFFSFFTILTNMMVALYLTVILGKTKQGFSRFFAAPNTAASITVYITIVGLVYNTILRFLWNPEGLQFIVDELLHSVMPVFFIVYWLIFVPKSLLQWKTVFPWLLYPLGYIVFILLRGALSGFYPYPFIDVNALGYGKVLVNSVVLFIVFLLFSLLFIAIGKMISRKSVEKKSL